MSSVSKSDISFFLHDEIDDFEDITVEYRKDIINNIYERITDGYYNNKCPYNIFNNDELFKKINNVFKRNKGSMSKNDFKKLISFYYPKPRNKKTLFINGFTSEFINNVKFEKDENVKIEKDKDEEPIMEDMAYEIYEIIKDVLKKPKKQFN